MEEGNPENLEWGEVRDEEFWGGCPKVWGSPF